MNGLDIKDIGQIGTEFVVFGGPYSNLQATEALLSACEDRGLSADQLVCTGDAVAYCGDPVAVLERLAGACHWVAGNCERQLAGGASDCGCGFETGSACDIWSAQWYRQAQRALKAPHLARMAQCPDIVTFQSGTLRCAALHGGATDIAAYLWPSDPDRIFAQEIDALERLVGRLDVVFAGHCGLAFERVTRGRRWINAGVIGLPPHDGRVQTRYVHFREGAAYIKRLSYDAQGAADALRAGGFPAPYAQALLSGIWPSEDVLPRALRR